ncbi:MAG TPA: hypothetical protein VHB21_27335, partial [Minicystis sp.]|nr:hypothetical protein [Minicystis sp.]
RRPRRRADGVKARAASEGALFAQTCRAGAALIAPRADPIAPGADPIAPRPALVATPAIPSRRAPILSRRALLDPLAKTLEVHARPSDGRYREVRVHQGDVRVRAAPFDAIELDLAVMWGPPEPTAR